MTEGTNPGARMAFHQIWPNTIYSLSDKNTAGFNPKLRNPALSGLPESQARLAYPQDLSLHG